LNFVSAVHTVVRPVPNLVKDSDGLFLIASNTTIFRQTIDSATLLYNWSCMSALLTLESPVFRHYH